MHTRVVMCVATCAVAILPATKVAATEQPLWEFGMGVGGVTFPAYRGSDTQSNWLLPVPYVIYRGNIVKADRDGMRGSVLANERVDLHLSVGGSIPVDSKEVDVRMGMPDLKPTIEFGPSLDIDLWRSTDGKFELDLRLPARYAITIESSPHSVGWQFTPRMALDISDPIGQQGWRFGIAAGPVFGSSRQHAYFYTVEDRYETPTRRAYDALDGYAGWQVLSSISKRFPKFWIGGFVRYDSLRGAVFEDSPLVTSDDYVAAGFGFAWIIAESNRRAPEKAR